MPLAVVHEGFNQVELRYPVFGGAVEAGTEKIKYF